MISGHPNLCMEVKRIAEVENALDVSMYVI